MNVGKRIKERRIALNMSVDELALKLDKDRSTIYRYESNEIEKLPTPILEPLAKILETTPGYLMGWNEDHFSNKEPNYPSIFQKYNRLNDIDKGKTEAYVDGLLESAYYKENKSAQKNGPEEKTKIKFAARNGRFIEKEFTEEEKEELLKNIDALPDADDL